MGATTSKELLSAGLFSCYVGVNLSNLQLAAASQRQQTRYVNSTAVALSEVLKSITCLLTIAGTEKSLAAAARVIADTLFGQPAEMLKVAFPAFLYTVQNNVIYSALSHLDAVSFQITYQLKIVASLVCTKLLLGTTVSRARWASVALLTAGVVLVQLSMQQDGAAQDNVDDSKKPLLGLISVLVACGCSGLAGAVMEALLKAKEVPIARRNLQVSAISLILAAVHMLSKDSAVLREGGFFQGYSPIVCSMVALDSMGGLLVSLLLKHTTSALKNFGAPIGIIVNCILSRYLLAKSENKPVNRQFVAGTSLVLLALGMYTASA